jgi:hypothetical protein
MRTLASLEVTATAGVPAPEVPLPDGAGSTGQDARPARAARPPGARTVITAAVALWMVFAGPTGGHHVLLVPSSDGASHPQRLLTLDAVAVPPLTARDALETLVPVGRAPQPPSEGYPAFLSYAVGASAAPGTAPAPAAPWARPPSGPGQQPPSTPSRNVGTTVDLAAEVPPVFARPTGPAATRPATPPSEVPPVRPPAIPRPTEPADPASGGVVAAPPVAPVDPPVDPADPGAGTAPPAPPPAADPAPSSPPGDDGPGPAPDPAPGASPAPPAGAPDPRSDPVPPSPPSNGLPSGGLGQLFADLAPLETAWAARPVAEGSDPNVWDRAAGLGFWWALTEHCSARFPDHGHACAQVGATVLLRLGAPRPDPLAWHEVDPLARDAGVRLGRSLLAGPGAADEPIPAALPAWATRPEEVEP